MGPSPTREPQRDGERERVPRLLREFAASLAKVGPDEKRLVDAAVNSCKELLRSRQCSVWLADASGSRLVLRAATGYEHLAADRIGKLSYPIDDPDDPECGITASIHLHQVPVSADTFDDLRHTPGYRGRHDWECYGVVPGSCVRPEDHPCQQFYGGPISLGTERFGVLLVQNKTVPDEQGNLRFSESDKAALDTVAAMLALALQHARAAQEARHQLERYQAFTVHAIRNELMPIETARDALVRLLGGRGIVKRDLEECLRFLKLGTEGVYFYLENLLKFLRAAIQREKMISVRPFEILQNEVWFLGEVSSFLLDCRLEVATERDRHALVLGDPEFLAAVVKELLRNARKAVFRRREREERTGSEPTRGLVEVRMSTEDAQGGLRGKHVCVRFADNGDAAIDARARADLERAWERVEEEASRPREGGEGRHGGLGLRFARWVISEHHGRVELDLSGGRTEVRVRLPVAAGASDGTGGGS